MIIDQVLFHVFDSFNSFIPNGQEYEAGFQQVCKEFLFYANYAAGKIQPWLGKTWKYNSDFTALTLILNTAAHWNDGQPFTSKDVAFTANMLMKNKALSGGATLQQFVKSIDTPDAGTITFNLTKANPRFHYQFICGIVGGFEVVPEHIWSKQDPLTFKDNPPVRTGPYKLDRVLPNQLMFIWKKDPNYWNKANLDPKPEYVVYRTAPVQDSDVEEFKRAQTDLGGNLDYQHMLAIKQSGYKNIEIESAFRDPCPRGMWINSDPSKGVLADYRFHWVLSYLLDRKKIGSEIWLIQTPPAQYPWADYKSNNVWTDAAIAKQYPLEYSPTKAAQLLDAMGAKAGAGGKRTYQGKPISIEIMTPTPVGQPEYEIGALVAQELEKLGISASARSYSGPIFNQKFTTGEFDVTSHWLCGVSFDPDQLYSQFEDKYYVPIGQRAINGDAVRLKDAAFTAVAEKLDAADPAAAATQPLFKEALTDYYKALPAIP
ncbi:MAG: ABC transporter substrate-binding protein, partial [Chloroflexi bacterium]|nr:ABC transporter substrate-binding protein [Chloroflexota bacterium]